MHPKNHTLDIIHINIEKTQSCTFTQSSYTHHTMYEDLGRLESGGGSNSNTTGKFSKNGCWGWRKCIIMYMILTSIFILFLYVKLLDDENYIYKVGKPHGRDEPWVVADSSNRKEKRGGENLILHYDFIMDGIVGSWRRYPLNTLVFFDKLVTFNVCCVIQDEFRCMSGNPTLFECKMTKNDDLECITRSIEACFASCVLHFVLCDEQ